MKYAFKLEFESQNTFYKNNTTGHTAKSNTKLLYIFSSVLANTFSLLIVIDCNSWDYLISTQRMKVNNRKGHEDVQKRWVSVIFVVILSQSFRAGLGSKDTGSISCQQNNFKLFRHRHTSYATHPTFLHSLLSCYWRIFARSSKICWIIDGSYVLPSTGRFI